MYLLRVSRRYDTTDSLTARPISCHNYIYKNQTYQATVVTDFNLVCNNAYLADLSFSLYYTGLALGDILAGKLAKKYGWKNVGQFSNILLFSSTLYSCFSPNIINYNISKFLVGLGQAVWQTVQFNYIMEIVGYKVRSKINFLWGCVFSLGIVLISYPLASLFKNWRVLHFSIALICLPSTILTFFVQPKSWRWLLSDGRVEEAIVQANQLGQQFGQKRHENQKIRENIEDLVELENELEENSGQNLTLFALFSSKFLCKVTFLTSLSFFTNTIGGFGVVTYFLFLLNTYTEHYSKRYQKTRPQNYDTHHHHTYNLQ